MKKLIYILIGIFTFSVGFWLYSLRSLVVPVSLCEISQHSEIYQTKQIHIKAYLDSVGRTEDDFDNYSVSDFEGECLTGASLYISEHLKKQLKNDESLKVSIDELRRRHKETFEKRDESGNYFAEVEIVGEIEKYTQTDTAGLVEPLPFVIKTSEIKQISPIRFISREEFLSLTGLK